MDAAKPSRDGYVEAIVHQKLCPLDRMALEQARHEVFELSTRCLFQTQLHPIDAALESVRDVLKEHFTFGKAGNHACSNVRAGDYPIHLWFRRNGPRAA
jgi:hypothetical protein